jgi:hypothetical protein
MKPWKSFFADVIDARPTRYQRPAADAEAKLSIHTRPSFH